MKGTHRRKKIEPMKPSVRFRSTVVPDSSFSNGSMMYDGSMALSESSIFPETDFFNPDGEMDAKHQSMTEKGIRRLCIELLDLKNTSTEEMQRNVYANYTAFIRTSQEVSDLEAELMAMKGLISTQAVLVRDLLEGMCFQSSADSRGAVVFQEESIFEEDIETSELERRIQILSDALDILFAECRVDEALTVLAEEEKIISDAIKIDPADATVASLWAAFSEQKVRLVEQLAEVAQQPSVCRNELCKAVSALKSLDEGSRAHTLLLKAYHVSRKSKMENLHPSYTWYTGSYTTALAQLFFSTILRASQDSSSIFGDVSAYASELVLWARRETEDYVGLVKKHILSFSAVSGGLRAAADSMQISVGHCCLLENEGLTLCPFLLRHLKPCVELVMEASLRHIEEAISVHVACDNWTFPHSSARAANGVSYVSAVGGFTTPMKLTRSAQRLNYMVQDLLDNMTPLMVMHFGRVALDGIATLFDKYIEMLVSAVYGPMKSGDASMEKGLTIVKAETDAQQLVLLGNAAALADELFPRAALKISSSYCTNIKEDSCKQVRDRQTAGVARLSEQKEWRRHLQRAVDRLRDQFCVQHALEFVYDKDGEALVIADFYINLYESGKDQFWQQDSMPSPPFQAFFFKLNSLTQLAADVLKGRERVIKLLLMRLLEAVLMWLSDNQDFWEAIEDGLETLTPIGLQQFVLDMHFLIQIASSGRFSSRQMRQVVSSCISRAVNAFSATGLDPNSVLPEDEWFDNTAKEAIQKLVTDKARDLSTCNEREPGSPTSVSSYSAYSMQGSP